MLTQKALNDFVLVVTHKTIGSDLAVRLGSTGYDLSRDVNLRGCSVRVRRHGNLINANADRVRQLSEIVLLPDRGEQGISACLLRCRRNLATDRWFCVFSFLNEYPKFHCFDYVGQAYNRKVLGWVSVRDRWYLPTHHLSPVKSPKTNHRQALSKEKRTKVSTANPNWRRAPIARSARVSASVLSADSRRSSPRVFILSLSPSYDLCPWFRFPDI